MGDVVNVVCSEGYSGGGNIECQTNGEFETTTCERNHNICDFLNCFWISFEIIGCKLISQSIFLQIYMLH